MSLPHSFFIGRSGGAGPMLYEWAKGSSYTFTRLGKTGAYGPASSTILSSYSGTPFADNGYLESPADGIQVITIPQAGIYEFDVIGARGGANSSGSGGWGARIKTQGPLEAGQKVAIVVGQKGTDWSGGACGGGGGSFAYLIPEAGFDTYALTDCIAAAGGGSGANAQQDQGIGSYGMPASANLLGTYGNPSSNGSSGLDVSYIRPAAGYAGMHDIFADNGRNYSAGPGAGFMTRPRNTDYRPNIGNGYIYVRNSGGDNTFGGVAVSEPALNDLNEAGSAIGGNNGSSYATALTNVGGDVSSGYVGPWVGGTGAHGDGGFGGGGGAARSCGGSGAGGGFSGGMATGCYAVSGAGGSFGRDSEYTTFTEWSAWTRTLKDDKDIYGNGSSTDYNDDSGHGLVTVTRVA